MGAFPIRARYTNEPRPILWTLPFCASQGCFLCSKARTAAGNSAEKRLRVTTRAQKRGFQVLNRRGMSATAAHAVTWVTMKPTEWRDTGLSRGRVGGKKGKEKQSGKKAWLSGFPHRAPHTMQFLLSDSPGWALSRAQEVGKSIPAANHNPAVSAPGSQEQVAATAQVPREWQGVLTASSEVSFGSLALSYYWYYFNSFLLGFPAFSCETSSEMPLLELITLSWQLEFSKFNSPPLLPSVNSPFPLAISCHKYKRNKTWKK